MRKSGLVCGFLLLISTPNLLAQTAGMVAFQGLIRDSGGMAIPGPTVALTFNIYDAPTGGNLVAGPFSSSPSPAPVVGGIVATQFGPVTPSAFNGSDRYLEVTVAGFPTLSRVLMASPPAIAEQLNARGTGTAAVVTLPNGNVGIGTPSASAGFHVVRSSAFPSNPTARFENSSGGCQIALNGSVSSHTWGIANAWTTPNDFFVLDHDGNTTGAPFMIQAGTGNVGIGTAGPPVAKLHIHHITATPAILVDSYVANPDPVVDIRSTRADSGDVLRVYCDTDADSGGPYGALIVEASGDIYGRYGLYHGPSDVRLKKDIANIKNALQRVLGLRGVNFRWKSPREHGDHLEVGMIAQEVEKQFPEAVHTADDRVGTKAVHYDRLVGVLVEAIKEQNRQIEELRGRERETRDRLAALEAAVAKTGGGQ